MIRIKINGILKEIKTYTILFLGLILTGCSAKQNIAKYNYFNKDYFYNDTLKVAINFWGSLDFKDPAKVKKAQLKHLLQNNKQLSLDNLFVFSSSNVNKYEMYFFFETVNKPLDNLVHEKITVEDSLSFFTIFEKQKGSKKIIGFVKSFESNNKYSSILAHDIIKRISIDSIDNSNLSFHKIWLNYSIKSKNRLQARKKIMTAPIKDNQVNGVKFQFLATINSFISNNPNYDDIINDYEKNRKRHYTDLVTSISKNQDVKKNQEVFDEIAALAKDNSVIMLNEDHYYPKHRLFAMELLDVLKQNGYTYLSLEAFSESEKNNFIPNYNNGFYTGEPYFAHFIRKAKKLGFIIVGHENKENNIDREVGQAKNIFKILEQDPKAKILVYVGHSHIEKGGVEKKWMAQYFKEFSKINPITINQASICADNDEDLMLIPNKYFADDVKTKSNADYFLINNLKTDFNKIFPITSFKDFVLKNKNFKKKEVQVEVFDIEEYDVLKKLAIPLINLLAIPKANTITLNLPIGKFNVIVKSEDNIELYNNIIVVQ